MSENKSPDSPNKVKHTPAANITDDAEIRSADLDYSFPSDDPADLPQELLDDELVALPEDAEHLPEPSESGGGGGEDGGNKELVASEDDDEDTDEPDDEDDNEEEDDEDDEEEDDEEQEGRGSQSIFEHFRELRTRLVRVAIAIVVGFGICWFFHTEIANIVYRPLINALPEGSNKASSIIFTGVAEGFLTHMKLSIVAGIFLMSPVIFYQIWAFIAPGLYDEEKRFVIPVAISSGLCFMAGGSFCYFVVFPNAFQFFMTYSDGPFQAMPSMKEYFGFTMQLMLAFGIIFEMPLFSFFLAKLGIVRASAMRRFRRYFIVIAFILGAFLTPPDPLSQLLMAGPLLILYELSIIIASFAGKKEEPAEEDEDDEDDESEDDEDTDEEETDEEEGDGEEEAAASPAQ